MEESAINAPHVDDATEEEDFFGGGEAEEETGLPSLTAADAAAEAARYAEEKGEARIEPAGEEGQADSTPSSLQEPAGDAVEGQAASTTTPPEGTAEAAGGAATATQAQKGGNPEREYIVLHRVPLTERLLEHLLEEVRSGNVAEPRVAFLELHRVTARNDRVAIGDAYKTHRRTLGEKCDLAAVSERGFKVRHVEPRQRVNENLSIT